MTVWVRRQLFLLEQRNKIVIGVLLLLVAALTATFLLISTAEAQTLSSTNKTIHFSARLKGANGASIPDGLYNVSFRLYDSGEGGSPIWSETYYDENGVAAGQDQRVKVTNGYLSVRLGSRTAFSKAIDWNENLWL